MKTYFDYGSISKDIKKEDIKILLERYIKSDFVVTFYDGKAVISYDKQIKYLNGRLKNIKDYLLKQYSDLELSMVYKMQLFLEEYKKTCNVHILKRYKDDTLYYSFWIWAFKKINKLDGLEKTSFEEETIRLQNIVKDNIKANNPNNLWYEKFNYLIEKVKEDNILYLHNSNEVFRDGQLFSSFYLDTKYRINTLKEKMKLSKEDMLYLYMAALLDDALINNRYREKIRLMNEKMNLLYDKALNGDFSLINKFDDQTQEFSFYNNLRNMASKYYQNKKELNEEEMLLIHTLGLYENLYRERGGIRGH